LTHFSGQMEIRSLTPMNTRVAINSPRFAKIKCACLLLITLLSGCGPGGSQDELPELPAVATSSFLPTVAGQLVMLQNAVETEPHSAGKAARLGMAYLAYDHDQAAEVALKRARLLDKTGSYADADTTWLVAFATKRFGFGAPVPGGRGDR
jgi:hypothetical protein